MEYLIRFAQLHETFRRPEIESLALLEGVDLEFVFYDEKVRVSLLVVTKSSMSFQRLPKAIVLNSKGRLF